MATLVYLWSVCVVATRATSSLSAVAQERACKAPTGQTGISCSSDACFSAYVVYAPDLIKLSCTCQSASDLCRHWHADVCNAMPDEVQQSMLDMLLVQWQFTSLSSKYSKVFKVELAVGGDLDLPARAHGSAQITAMSCEACDKLNGGHFGSTTGFLSSVAPKLYP